MESADFLFQFFDLCFQLEFQFDEALRFCCLIIRLMNTSKGASLISSRNMLKVEEMLLTDFLGGLIVLIWLGLTVVVAEVHCGMVLV